MKTEIYVCTTWNTMSKKLNKFCAANVRVKAMPTDCVLCGENEADILKEHFENRDLFFRKRLCKRKPQQSARFWELWKTCQKNKVLQHCANTKHKKWTLDHPWRWQTYKWAQTDFLWPVEGWEAGWNIWKFAVVFQMSTSSAAYSSVIHLNLRV